MANNYFQFNQFKIIQKKSAMKVGTDGTLLGAWTNISNTKTILDVGTGTGLIALMLAQRTKAKIIGIEIEKNAAEEATENVQNSPWENRVTIENISFQEFLKSTKKKFDLIVSNPPFFTNSFKSDSKNRTLARHNNSLPFLELIKGAVKLLNEKGRLSVILPDIPAEEFIKLAKNEGLNLIRSTKVKPKSYKKTNRILMEFSKENTIPEYEYLIVYNEDGSDYSEMYKKLTRNFYLNF